MGNSRQVDLSRRERQIMDIVYEKGEASARAVAEMMPDPPSYSAVRALLGILEEKGCLRHEQQGRTYIYLPRISRARARQSALSSLVQNFFDGSVEQAVASLVNLSAGKLSDDELDRLEAMIREKRDKE